MTDAASGSLAYSFIQTRFDPVLAESGAWGLGPLVSGVWAWGSRLAPGSGTGSGSGRLGLGLWGLWGLGSAVWAWGSVIWVWVTIPEDLQITGRRLPPWLQELFWGPLGDPVFGLLLPLGWPPALGHKYCLMKRDKAIGAFEAPSSEAFAATSRGPSGAHWGSCFRSALAPGLAPNN